MEASGSSETFVTTQEKTLGLILEDRLKLRFRENL
jgi:hypothetical protein